MPYDISEDELNGLLYMYHQIRFGLDHYKGLQYKYCFNAMKGFKQAAQEFKKLNANIDDYVIVCRD